MNPQESTNDIKDVCKTWKFVYNDCLYPNLSEYPDGYYINVITDQKEPFRPGIKHIVGNDNEDKVYNMWWLENG
jgi:hypothetical protein